jgi:site-specific DNA-methyltransferase (adenine-specific)
MTGTVVNGDNLESLKKLESSSIQLIYTDPPFNTGDVQRMKRVKSKLNDSGSVGFAGSRYSHETVSDISYLDSFSDYIDGWLVHLDSSSALISPLKILFRTPLHLQ